MLSDAKNSLWLAEFVERMGAKLPPAEHEYAMAMLGIVGKYGKLEDGDKNGIWVGYNSANENDNKEMGIKCSNCYFYQSEKECMIVKREIEPEGLCRLAAIPPGAYRPSQGGQDGQEG
jgi:hypothetical protein